MLAEFDFGTLPQASTIDAEAAEALRIAQTGQAPPIGKAVWRSLIQDASRQDRSTPPSPDVGLKR